MDLTITSFSFRSHGYVTILILLIIVLFVLSCSKSESENTGFSGFANMMVDSTKLEYDIAKQKYEIGLKTYPKDSVEAKELEMALVQAKGQYEMAKAQYKTIKGIGSRLDAATKGFDETSKKTTVLIWGLIGLISIIAIIVVINVCD